MTHLFAIGAQPVIAAADPTGQFFYVFATSNVKGVDMEFLYEYTMDGVTGALTVTSFSPTTWEFGNGILITPSMAFNAAVEPRIPGPGGRRKPGRADFDLRHRFYQRSTVAHLFDHAWYYR